MNHPLPKLSFIFALASVIAISPLAIDMYLPAMPIIAEALNTSINTVQNSLSIYLVGYAIGAILWGPLVDKYGRLPFLIIGLLGFFVCAMLLPLTKTGTEFLVLRFLQAFISSAATVIVPGIIRDLYKQHVAKGMSYVAIIMMIAPMIAPTIGTGILLLSNWQSIFISMAIYALIILMFCMVKLPRQLLRGKNDSAPVPILTRYKRVIFHAETRIDLLGMMMGSLAFFCYLTAIPFVYIEAFNTSESLFSLLFAVNVCALMLAHTINSRLVVKLGSRIMLRIGAALAFLAALCLFLVNITEQSLWFTVVFIFPLMGSLSLISVNSDALIVLQHKESAGTASATLSTLKFGIGACAGPLLALLHDGSTMPFATIMFVCACLIALCQFHLYHKQKLK